MKFEYDEMFNYKDLLIKYIKWVGDNEGITFLSRDLPPSEYGFTIHEWRELKRLDSKIK